MDKAILIKQRLLLAKILRQLRLERALGQSDVAKRLGTPQSYISKYETGERRIDLVEVCKICVALDVDPVEVLNRFTAQVEMQ
jgi:transcriptional regulator with XRE-family HTH domain